MKNITPDPAEPIGEVTIVNDFLPSPDELVPKKNTPQKRDWLAILQNTAGSIPDLERPFQKNE